jgi:hypothetical protein
VSSVNQFKTKASRLRPCISESLSEFRVVSDENPGLANKELYQFSVTEFERVGGGNEEGVPIRNHPLRTAIGLFISKVNVWIQKKSSYRVHGDSFRVSSMLSHVHPTRVGGVGW